jgi:UDP-3-O-[3-hydroxymyristoyl] glucosamine N-acyltransferase
MGQRNAVFLTHNNPKDLFYAIHNKLYNELDDFYNENYNQYQIPIADGIKIIKIEGKLINIKHYGGIRIGKNVKIGPNTVIGKGVIKGENTIIKDNVTIGYNCCIGHHSIIGSGSIIVDGAKLGGSVIIGKNCWIGLGAIINDHIEIGGNCLIGSGAVVIKNVENNSVAVGNPARIIRQTFDAIKEMTE